MKYLVKDKELKLRYVPEKGAWTYHVSIPGTSDMHVRWGYTKVAGSIDNYKIKSKNLALFRGEDAMISINETIRKAINKTGGDFVTVTLYLLPENK